MSENARAGQGLRIGHVAGVSLNKWRRIWGERFEAPLIVEDVPDADQVSVLLEDRVDMCFVRAPFDRDGLHAIPLYEEQMVAWISKENDLAALDELTMADLADEQVLTEASGSAPDLLLAGVVLLVPMSIARGASRRDLTYRPVTDAGTSPVALAWRVDDENPLIEEFIGVVRGRTANSSRGRADGAVAVSRADATPARGAQQRTPQKRTTARARSSARKPRRRGR